MGLWMNEKLKINVGQMRSEKSYLSIFNESVPRKTARMIGSALSYESARLWTVKLEPLAR